MARRKSTMSKPIERRARSARGAGAAHRRECAAPRRAGRGPRPLGELEELPDATRSPPCPTPRQFRARARARARARPRATARPPPCSRSTSTTSRRSTSATAASPATPRSRHVARLLKSLIRASDVAARNGGGAFSLLLDHLDPDSALDTGERIARCIAAHPLDLGHAEVPLEVDGQRRHDPARRHASRTSSAAPTATASASRNSDGPALGGGLSGPSDNSARSRSSSSSSS